MPKIFPASYYQCFPFANGTIQYQRCDWMNKGIWMVSRRRRAKRWFAYTRSITQGIWTAVPLPFGHWIYLKPYRKRGSDPLDFWKLGKLYLVFNYIKSCLILQFLCLIFHDFSLYTVLSFSTQRCNEKSLRFVLITECIGGKLIHFTNIFGNTHWKWIEWYVF